MPETLLFHLSDDIILKILHKLDGDPRHWARLACVCTKFSFLVRSVCYKHKCSQAIPSIVADLLSYPAPLGSHPLDPSVQWWASLHNIAVCCPGLFHAGVLLENSDFGLEREIGPDHSYTLARRADLPPPTTASSTSSNNPGPTSSDVASWSLFDDLYFDTVYDRSEAHLFLASVNDPERAGVRPGTDRTGLQRRLRSFGPAHSHPASGTWNLSREQGNKLLASRFRGDCLYICDWPGCVHNEEKRNYMLFRGIFKNFKRSRVWRTINDGNRGKTPLGCAFCSCRDTYDLHSAFCLRRVFGYHDDGEPVVRAYVCENGHVSGAWTDRPMAGYVVGQENSLATGLSSTAMQPQLSQPSQSVNPAAPDSRRYKEAEGIWSFVNSITLDPELGINSGVGACHQAYVAFPGEWTDGDDEEGNGEAT